MPLYDYEHKGRKATYTKGEPVDAVRYIILQDVTLPTFLQKEIVVSAPVLFYAGDTVTGKQIKTKVYGAINNAVFDLDNVYLNASFIVLNLDTKLRTGFQIQKIYDKQQRVTQDGKYFNHVIRVQLEEAKTLRSSGHIKPEQLFFLLEKISDSAMVAQVFPHYAKLYMENPREWAHIYFYCKLRVEGTL